MGFNLAELFVTFTAKGVETTKSAISSVGSAFNFVASAAATGAASLAAFASAGLASSAMGERIEGLMGQLSRGLAGVFAPIIEKVIDGLQWLVNTMQTWGQVLMDLVQKALYFSGAMLVWTAIKPVLAGIWEGFQKIIEVFRPLWEQAERVLNGVWNLVLKVAGGVGGVLGRAFAALGKIIAAVLEPLVKMLTFVLEATERLLRMLGADVDGPAKRKFSPLAARGGGQEDIRAIYNRVQMQGLKTAAMQKEEEEEKERPKEIVKHLKNIDEKTVENEKHLKSIKEKDPAIGP